MEMTNVLFDALKNEKFAEKIAQRIMQIIGSGELRPSDVLPSERELANSFQVSRAVVREALGMLAVRGLVTIHQGKPTLVSDVSQWNTLDPKVLLLLRNASTFHELMELRVPKRLPTCIPCLTLHITSLWKNTSKRIRHSIMVLSVLPTTPYCSSSCLPSMTCCVKTAGLPSRLRG